MAREPQTANANKERAASSNQTRKRRKRPNVWLRRIGLFFGGLTTLFLLVIVTAFGYIAYRFYDAAKALPKDANIDSLIDYRPGGLTEIYATDKDPKTHLPVLLGRVYRDYKEFIPIDEIPEVMKNATVSIEDERFYQHPGVDVKGIARAIYRNVRGGRMSEGASTLTQQLARNVYLTKSKTIDRKIQEVLLAIQLEKNFSKEQILQMYLNEVNYGGNTYGVKAAAQQYFGKKVKELSISQAALLAGIPQRPYAFDLYKHKKEAIERRNVVLSKMAELHYITPDQARIAKTNGYRLISSSPPVLGKFKAPYFTNYVLRQLVDKYGEDAVYTSGLKVYTTLNYKMQQEGERALANGVLNAHGEGVTDGALVCVEPRTGFIRTMVGGVNYEKDQYNFAAQGGRQPGSSFKVFVYTAAMDSRPNRFSQYGEVDNRRIRYGKYLPGGSGPSGPVSMRTAITYSYNNAAVNTANAIGVNRVIDYARRMGIKSEIKPTLALALGSYNVTPLEMASAYSLFPAGGNHAEPMSIIRVIDGEGIVLENNVPQVDRAVIPESVVGQMSDMLANVVAEGTASKAAGIHEVSNAHGKTGTTNDNRDAWFVGYTPELTTAVWVCGIQRSSKNRPPRYPPMSGGSTGGHVCAPVWARFMKAAVPIQRRSGEPIERLPEKTLTPGDRVIVDNSGGVRRAPNRAESDSAGDKPRSSRRRRAATNATTTAAPAEAQSAPGATNSGMADAAESANAVPATRPADATAPEAASPRNAEQIAPPPVEPPAVTVAAPPRRLRVTPPSVRERPSPQPEREIEVSVCADSGGRATRWCPETVTRTFRAGHTPGRCRMHGPRSGDQ